MPIQTIPPSQAELVTLAKQIATEAGVYPALFCAIAEQESSWNPWAIRYEPAFYVHYIMPMRNLSATEAYGRAFSWGLCQIMGETAREEGYKDDFPKLCDPETGLKAGVTHLKNKLEVSDNDITKALLLWNGGANPAYPREVIARISQYKN